MAGRFFQRTSTDGAARSDLVRMIGRVTVLCLSLLAMPVSGSAATASDYPNRVIKLIVASAPGGPTDALARPLADALSAELGQSVIVENRSGAGGVTGFAMGANAAPDGYTLVVVDQSMTVQPSMYPDLPYDIEKDFTPISLFVRSISVLVARKTLEANDPAELVALARREPGKLTYGSAGTGSPVQLKAEFFKIVNGLDIRHVPYRGGLPALMDLVAGRIDIMFSNAGTARPQIEAGTVKALAVLGKERLALLPNVPTFYEVKLPMPQLDSGSWWGVMGPAKLPVQIQSKLNEAVGKALKNPQLLKQFDEMSSEPFPSTSKELSDIIASERVQWADVMKKAGIKPE
jgi:tripartite-type tricarboxylate transporter receptor subunit TctC